MYHKIDHLGDKCQRGEMLEIEAVYFLDNQEVFQKYACSYPGSKLFQLSNEIKRMSSAFCDIRNLQNSVDN